MDAVLHLAYRAGRKVAVLHVHAHLYVRSELFNDKAFELAGLDVRFLYGDVPRYR